MHQHRTWTQLQLGLDTGMVLEVLAVISSCSFSFQRMITNSRFGICEERTYSDLHHRLSLCETQVTLICWKISDSFQLRTPMVTKRHEATPGFPFYGTFWSLLKGLWEFLGFKKSRRHNIMSSKVPIRKRSRWTSGSTHPVWGLSHGWFKVEATRRKTSHFGLRGFWR